MTKETKVEEKNEKISKNIRRESRGKTQVKNVRGNRDKKEFSN